jgi:acetylornithine deacetylase
LAPESPNIENLTEEAIELLRSLIRIPRISRNEDTGCEFLMTYLRDKDFSPERQQNNVWIRSRNFDPAKKTILLNSHIDTVKPASSYTRDPFDPQIEDGKLFGLGSNDAGGALVSLFTVFRYFENRQLPVNLIFAATAEEEISGSAGITSILPSLGTIDFAIIGEPTGMNVAIAEKGLIVVDCEAHGKSGHAARAEGVNAIYKALKDIEWIKNYQFPKTSQTLGPIHMAVTQIDAGTAHNVIPDRCHFVIDVRTTDAYTNEDVASILAQNLTSEVNPRSLRLQPSAIDPEHPFVKTCVKYGAKTYGSPTLSDQALLTIPSVKFSPGESARSHTADEFIYVSEIEQGISKMIAIFGDYLERKD